MYRSLGNFTMLVLLVASTANGDEFHRLGGLAMGRTFTFPYDVSGDGRVVVGLSAYSPDTLDFQAFRWTIEGGMTGLGFVSPSGYESIATAVSRDGAYIIGSSNAIPQRAEFRWNANDGMIAISSNHDLLPRLCEAYDISANGMIVVGKGCSDSSEAAMWSHDGGFVSLGDLPGGRAFGSASAISADGSTVVGFGSDENGIQGVSLDGNGRHGRNR